MPENPIKYTFNFDTNSLKELRATICEKIDVSIKKTDTLKKSKKFKNYKAWDRICVIMDRLEDTIDYLNTMTLGRCRSQRSAFDFYEFINNAYIVVECIKIMASIFGVEKARKDIESTQNIFGNVLNVNGCDGDFFEYIRSLCAVHPTETSREKYRYLKDALFHCCPFVVWNQNQLGLGYDDGRDLSAFVYQSKENENTIIIPLYIDQFKKYIQAWLNLVPIIIESINKYNENEYEKLRKQKMNEVDSFENICDYIAYLRDEQTRRYLSGQEYIYNYFIRVFQTKFSNEINNQKLEKYKNAIKYSLQFRHHSLQFMNDKGYENSGIKDQEGDLFNLLEYPYCLDGCFKSFSYNLGKVSHLFEDGNRYEMEKDFARYLINEMGDVLNKYVIYTGKESDDEKIVLVSLALYFDALEHKCVLNKNIPNEKLYREKILSDEEMQALDIRDEYEPVNLENMIISVENEDGSIVEIKFTDFIKGNKSNQS